MASLINTIVTKFTAEGAEQTASATDNVTKAQTRLGNSSSSSGRQFAAQSQGLGGLVAAYAGAAATSFALQQAFSALQKAAQFDQIIQGTNTFSSQFGQSATSVIGDIKRITQGQLSIVEAATAANLALSAGFNTKQLNELADVATKSSRALGRDLSDSFDRLVKGSAKLEPELLDELGIFTRIEPAVEKYAASLNRSVSSLTEFERRQAFVNAVIAEGQSKFSIIDSSNATASQSYSKLAATLTDLALKIGNVIANALAPLADYISGNLATAFGAFGIIITLVLGKLNELVLVGLTNANKKITEVSNSLSTNFLGSGKKSAEVLQELAVATGNFDTKLKKGLGTNADARDNLIGLASAGKASVNQLKELNIILEANNKVQNKDIETAKRRLANNAEGTSAFKNNTANLERATRAQEQNTAQITANNKVIEVQNKFANAGAVAVAGFGKGLSLIGSFASGLLKTFNILLLGISLFGLLGPKILEAFGVKSVVDKFIEGIGSIINNFLGLDKVSLQTKKGIDGVAAAITKASFEAKGLKGDLEGEIKIPTFFGTASIKINAETIQKDIADAISGGFKAAEAVQQDFQNDIDRRKDALIAASAISRKVNSGRQVPGLDAANAELAILEDQNNAEDMKIRKREAYNAAIDKGIAKANEYLGKAGQDANTTRLLLTQIVSLEKIKNLGQQQVEIGGYIAATTGLSATKVAEVVKINENGLAVIKGTSGELSVQFKTLEELKKLKGQELINATATQDISAKLVTLTSNIVTDTEKLKKGQLDLNGLGKTRADQLAFEKSIREEIEKLQEDASFTDKEALKVALEKLEVKKKEREAFLVESALQEATLKIQDQTRKSFSSQIESLNQINGLINLNGDLARTSLEVEANKLDALEAQVAVGDAIQKRVDAIKQSQLSGPEYKPTGDEAAILSLAETAKKAIGGSIGDVFKKAYEVTLEYQKQTDELQKQAMSIKSGIERERLNNAIQLNDKQKEYNTLVIQNQLNAIERQKRLNELSAERIDILRKGREDEAKSMMSGVLGPLFTDKNKRDIEIKFKEEELNDLKRALGAQVASAAATLQKEKELATENYAREIEKLNFQKSLIDVDAKSKEEELTVRKKEFEQNAVLAAANFTAISRQIEVFTKHPEELSKVFNDFLNNYSKLLAITTPDKAKEISDLTVERQVREKQLGDSIKLQLDESKSKLTETFTALTTAQDALRTSLNELGSSYGDNQKALEKINQQERDIAKLRMSDSVAASQAKYNNVLAETGNKLLAATQSLEILKREAERANNSFVILAVKSAEAITNNIEKSLNSLVDAVANGTLTMQNFKQGFKQMIVSILSDITKAIVNEVITKPIKEMVFGFTRDLIGGFSGGDISKKLAESVGPAIGGQLTQSFADLPKAIAGFKELGVTSVFIVGAAPGALCCGGAIGGAAESAVGGAAESAVAPAVSAASSAVAPAAVRAAQSAAQDNAGRVLYNSPIGPNMPAVQAATRGVAASAVTPMVYRGVQTERISGDYLKPPDTVKLDNTTPLEVTAVTSTGGAIDPNAIGNIGAFGAFSGYQPRELFSPSTWSGTALNPTTNDAFGALGPMNGYRFGTGPEGSGYATSFGGSAPQNLGIGGGSSQFNMQQFTNPAFSTDAGGKLQNRADTMMRGGGDGGDAGGGLNVDGINTQLDTTAGKVGELGVGTEALNTNFTDFGGKILNAESGVQNFANTTDTGVTSLNSLATTSGAVDAAKAGEQIASVAETAATQATTPAIAALGAAAQTSAAQMGGGGGGGFSMGGVLIDGIGGLFASGGSVGGGGAFARFAAGGGVMTRDRIPALLEPGEFVMKKTSVDSIGRSSMERMNATGKSSGSPTNIKIQVDNSGQPKEAQQGETQFDGETAIVKLILKDLSSNGPIRRSIRGNT